MKLYLTPAACSLADHIALCEAKIAVETVKVDLTTRRMEDGGDFTKINPKGYVPALELDDGTVLTENAAILCWVADRAPDLAPHGEMGRIRLIEMLSFIASEIHKPFIRSFFPIDEKDRETADRMIATRLAFLEEQLCGDYLFGESYSVADAYLYVMLHWANLTKRQVPAKLAAFFERVHRRPAVQEALRREGLAQ
ncbi:glutathione S-transferase family protein [Dongia soli]|uniref:Glutathione binding-like protein n=1 Tax=Dongia soli TaxID=600628 RepID=A0ABU5EEP2_9PROT|nr:glutathione S-transferase family protein [Dongia soli]MDY0884494.1 glutathione binding-like protein [Dongia soli]